MVLDDPVEEENPTNPAAKSNLPLPFNFHKLFYGFNDVNKNGHQDGRQTRLVAFKTHEHIDPS